MVDVTETTPFRGVMNSNRQKNKAAKGTEVEVRIIKEGQYGWYALAFKDGEDKPVFLNPANIDRIGDVSDERKAELVTEREAWKAAKNAPIEIGAGDLHTSGKSIVVPVVVFCGGNAVIRQAFFPLSQVTESDGIYSAPPWLAKIKAHDAAYYFLSSGGRKGVNHLGGRRTALSAGIGNIEYSVGHSDLQAAEGRFTQR